jgi:WD40 repeat protein
MKKSSSKREIKTRTEQVIDQLKRNPIVLIIGVLVVLLGGVAGVMNNISTIETNLHNFLPSPPTPTPSAMPVYIYRAHGDSVSAIAWSPDGRRVASGSADGTVQVWDATTGENRLIYHQLSTTTDGVCSIAWSPNGKYIASGSDDGTVHVWDASTDDDIFTYRSSYFDSVPKDLALIHASEPNYSPPDIIFLAWSPDSKFIASTRYWSVHVWDIAARHEVHIYLEPDQLGDLTWSINGQYIASATGKSVRVQSATTGQQIVTFNADSNFVKAVAWSPDSLLIASGGHDGKVQIWYALAGVNINDVDQSGLPHNVNLTCSKHDPVITIAWSPNRRYIAYGCLGNPINTLHIWDFVAQQSSTYHGIEAAWSPDGRRLAIANGLTVEVWQTG